MKKRIKIDSSILSFIIIITGFLYLFPELYARDLFWDSVLDFIGFISILKGVVLRMAARGHKKAHSHRSKILVTGGPYSITRNPMYLGSFMIGIGFVFIVWPWWSFPIFGCLFYLRFKKQVVKEEKILTKTFGKEYTDYCQKVARIFPSLKDIFKIKLRDLINLNEVFNTKEKRGLWGWPLLAVALEYFQESLVFGVADLGQILYVFVMATVVYAISFAFKYVIH